jgi:hypothetical protein
MNPKSISFRMIMRDWSSGVSVMCRKFLIPTPSGSRLCDADRVRVVEKLREAHRRRFIRLLGNRGGKSRRVVIQRAAFDFGRRVAIFPGICVVRRPCPIDALLCFVRHTEEFTRQRTQAITVPHSKSRTSTSLLINTSSRSSKISVFRQKSNLEFKLIT